MAVNVTGAQCIQRVLRASGLGLYIPNADIVSIGASAFTSVKWLRRGYLSPGEFSDKRTTIWRPGAATAADYYRSAALLTVGTGVQAPDAAWADITLGTEDFYFVYYDLNPQLLVDAANRALRNLYFENLEPLSLAADAGFQATGTGSYTESDVDGGPATGFTKITTADSNNIFSGIGAGRVLNTAADGYIRQRFDVARGEEVYVGALFKADVGRFELGLRDITNGADLGTQIVSTEEKWAYAWRKENVTSGAAGTEILEVRLRGDGATDDIYYSGLWVYRTQDNLIRLSTTWEQTAFRIPTLAYMTFGKSLANQVDDAFSRQLVPIDPRHYSFLQARADANPYAVQFHENWGQYYMSRYPIYIQGRRAHSDVDGPVTEVLTQTSSVDLDLWEAATRIELFTDGEVKRKVPNASELLRAARADFRDKAPQFVAEGPAERKPPWIPNRLGN